MTEILLAVAITLLLVLIFLYLRTGRRRMQGPRYRLCPSVWSALSGRKQAIQGRSRGEFSRFQRELKDDMARQEIRSREDSKSLRESFEQFSAHLDAGLEKNFKTFDETIRGAFQPDGQIFSRTERTHNSRTEGYYRDTR